jgi:hypothetical protein
MEEYTITITSRRQIVVPAKPGGGMASSRARRYISLMRGLPCRGIGKTEKGRSLYRCR